MMMCKQRIFFAIESTLLLLLFSNNKSIGCKRYENIYLYYEWCKSNDKVNAYLLGLSKMKPRFCEISCVLCNFFGFFK
jgi:hypothetical protein